MSALRRLVFAVVCLLWAGILLGVSLGETVKFRVPTLSRTAAFDVGRTVFHVSQTLQLLPLGMALASGAVGRLSRAAWACLAVAALALFVQTVWLFPVLDARAQTIIDGGVPVGHSTHAAYATLEVVKVLALIAAAVLALKAKGPAEG
jgi:uncharacterized membrane protein